MSAPEKDQWSRGDWMQTFTDRRFYPLDPMPSEVCSEDIAHALSLICRYGGHVTRFYSVAEHCVLMSHAVSAENALWALLHDAAEAYIGDMVRPLKRSMHQFQVVESRIFSAIGLVFDLPYSDSLVDGMPAEVKEADNRILLDERAALLRPTAERWGVEDLQPLCVAVHGWSPAEAESAYLARLAELTGATA